MAIQTLADVTITATAAKLSATSVKANWVLVYGQSLAGAARIGDSNVSTTRGGIIAATNGSLLLPSVGNTNCYDLSAIYIVGTANDKAAIIYNTV